MKFYLIIKFKYFVIVEEILVSNDCTCSFFARLARVSLVQGVNCEECPKISARMLVGRFLVRFSKLK